MAYKKSFLGMGWILLGPIIGIISWVFMNATGILNPGDVGIPYPAYVLLSSSIWGLFMAFYGAAGNTLGAGGGFIMQVKYPHEALLAKEAFQATVNFGITFLINLAVLLLFGVFPTLGILLFPLLLLPLFFLGSAIGLLISVVSVVAQDVSRFMGTILGFLLYITPVIYSPDTTNELLALVVRYNPLTYLIGAPRDVLVYGRYEYWLEFTIVTLFCTIFFLLATRLFYVSEDRVIEKML